MVEERKIQYLLNEFQNRPLESDLSISLFYTSLHSTKNYLICHPFPYHLLPGSSTGLRGDKDFESLKSMFQGLPGVNMLQSPGELERLSETMIELLYFIIHSNGDHTVHQQDYTKFAKKTGYLRDISALDHLKSSQTPAFVFKFKYSQEKALHRTFSESARSSGHLFGYHGSSNENWNSIIKGRGFDAQFISAQCIFGPGFYFSSDSKVSQSFVKWGKWWPQSIFVNGRPEAKVGCLSGCNILNTKHTLRGAQVHPTDSKHSHQFTKEDQALPEHYILARTASDIQVRYILLFQESVITPVPQLASNTSINQLQRVTSPPQQLTIKPVYIVMALFLLYIFILLFIGYSKNTGVFKSLFKQTKKSSGSPPIYKPNYYTQ